MTRKRGLGKGLDALIPSGMEPPADAGGILQVSVDDLTPNPRQPRKDFDPKQLQELADSIAAHGVLQPLVVSPSEEGDGYQLIVGERRLLAARIAGLERVPVILRQVEEEEYLAFALIENLQRTDLNPLEVAEGYQQLASDFNLSHEAIAKWVGKSRAAVTNTMRLLKLSVQVRTALRNDVISEGHARALLGLPSAQAQNAALQTVKKLNLNVRQTEELVRRLSGEKRKRTKKVERSPDVSDIEEKLREALGTRVTLRRSRRGGSIVIHYYSDEELNALIDRILESATS